MPATSSLEALLRTGQRPPASPKGRSPVSANPATSGPSATARGLPGWWCGGIEQPDPVAPRRPGPKPPFLPGCAGLGDLPGVRLADPSRGGVLSRLRVVGSLRALGWRGRPLDDDLAAGAGCERRA